MLQEEANKNERGTPTSTSLFLIGQCVELHSLNGAAHLNGRQGVVLAHDEAAARFVIRVDPAGDSTVSNNSAADDSEKESADAQHLYRLKAENLTRPSLASLRISDGDMAALISRVLVPKSLVSPGFAFVDTAARHHDAAGGPTSATTEFGARAPAPDDHNDETAGNASLLGAIKAGFAVVTAEQLIVDLKAALIRPPSNGRARVGGLGEELGLGGHSASAAAAAVVQASTSIKYSSRPASLSGEAPLPAGCNAEVLGCSPLEAAVRALITSHQQCSKGVHGNGNDYETFRLVGNPFVGGSTSCSSTTSSSTISSSDLNSMEIVSSGYLRTQLCGPRGVFLTEVQRHGGVLGVGSLASAVGLPVSFVFDLLCEEEEGDEDEDDDKDFADVGGDSKLARAENSRQSPRRPSFPIPGTLLDVEKRMVVAVELEQACISVLRSELLLSCGYAPPSSCSAKNEVASSSLSAFPCSSARSASGGGQESRLCPLDASFALRIRTQAFEMTTALPSSKVPIAPLATSGAAAAYFDSAWCSAMAQNLIDSDGYVENGDDDDIHGRKNAERCLKGQGFLRSGGLEFMPASYVSAVASRALSTLRHRGVLAYDSTLAQELASLSGITRAPTSSSSGSSKERSSGRSGGKGKNGQVAAALLAAVQTEEDVKKKGQSSSSLTLPSLEAGASIDDGDKCPGDVCGNSTSLLEVFFMERCALSGPCVSELCRLVADAMSPPPLPDREAVGFEKDCSDDNNASGDGIDDGGDADCNVTVISKEMTGGGAGWIDLGNALAVAFAFCESRTAVVSGNGDTHTALDSAENYSDSSLLTPQEVFGLVASVAVNSGALLSPSEYSLRRASAVVVSSTPSSLPPSPSSSPENLNLVSVEQRSLAYALPASSFQASHQEVEALVAEAILLVATRTTAAATSGNVGIGTSRKSRDASSRIINNTSTGTSSNSDLSVEHFGSSSSSSSSSLSTFTASSCAAHTLTWPPSRRVLFLVTAGRSSRSSSGDKGDTSGCIGCIFSRSFAAQALRVIAADALQKTPTSTSSGPASLSNITPTQTISDISLSTTTGDLEEEEEVEEDEEDEDEEEWCIAGVGASFCLLTPGPPSSLLQQESSKGKSKSSANSAAAAAAMSTKMSAKEKRRVRQAGKTAGGNKANDNVKDERKAGGQSKAKKQVAVAASRHRGGGSGGGGGSMRRRQGDGDGDPRVIEGGDGADDRGDDDSNDDSKNDGSSYELGDNDKSNANGAPTVTTVWKVLFRWRPDLAGGTEEEYRGAGRLFAFELLPFARAIHTILNPETPSCL